MKKQATKESRRAELWVYGFLIAAVLGVLMGFTLDICRGLKDWDSGLPRLYLGLDGLMISDINAGSKDEKYTVLIIIEETRVFRLSADIFPLPFRKDAV